ncbi:MAG: hypothetical protein GY858_05230 [Candidatus Omnitrophica bacterium]|nr:hypothetical protein [Candidatus Omnitrophota bacterium]
MDKNTTFSREFLGGLLIGAVAALIIYAVFVFCFYDVHLLCRLRVAGVRLQAEQIEHEADHRSSEILQTEEMAARKKLLAVQGKWVSRLGKAREDGLRQYVKTYFQYSKERNEARLNYSALMQSAKERAIGIKESARVETKALIDKAKKETSLVPLLLRGKMNQRSITGYFYDPDTGSIEPRLDLQLKIKEEK